MGPAPDRRGLALRRRHGLGCAAALRRWAEPGRRIDLALTTGGTGLSPRDVTPEAAMRVIDRPHAGLMELARLRCACAPAGDGVAYLSKRQAGDPRPILSRGVAGSAGRTLIITLPGSPQDATETLAALLDVLPHATALLRGKGHEPRPSEPHTK